MYIDMLLYYCTLYVVKLHNINIKWWDKNKCTKDFDYFDPHSLNHFHQTTRWELTAVRLCWELGFDAEVPLKSCLLEVGVPEKILNTKLNTDGIYLH